MALAAVIASRLSSLPPAHRVPRHDDASSISSEDASPGSSSMSSSYDTRSIFSEPCAPTEPGPSDYTRPRRNEHLAVLLPKRLWKPDSQAAHCDTFSCRKHFSIWERRHHCRKCGGVYCGDCSSKTTSLLDTSNLNFFHPPRNVPIIVYDSPTSQVLESRVCNDCHDLIHGRKSPRSPVISKASPIALVRESETGFASGSSSLSSSVSTPSDSSPLHALPPRPRPRRTHTSPRISPSSPLVTTTPLPNNPVLIADAELLGELEAYPLRIASNVCKATGGGRWEPKPIPEYVTKRIPGCKPAYELELEREEAERKLRRANPVFRDGDFQLRAPREMEPRSPGGPFTLSTF